MAPWAVATAEELHRQFGDDVELRVGALPYPPGPEPRPRPVTTPLPDLLDSREITVELDGPAVVRSGHTLRHSLLVRNLSGRDLQIATNGQVTAVVVDPQTGEVVGGFSGCADLAAGHLPGGGRSYRANPAADRHGQLYAPAWLCGSSRGMGNPGNAHARPAPPRLTQQAHTDPAPHNHRLNQATRSRLAPGTPPGPHRPQRRSSSRIRLDRHRLASGWALCQASWAGLAGLLCAGS